MSDPVHEIAPPVTARRRSTLAHVDYQDGFLVQTEPDDDRTPEEWARAVLEGAPAATRSSLWLGWSGLGLRVAPPGTEGHVLGWKLRRSDAEHVLLGADSRVGMPAELLLERRDDRLLFCTFVEHDNPVVRATWAGVIPVHRQVVPRILGRAISFAGLAV